MAKAVKAAIYCRISSDREGLKLNVETQGADCREACQAQGWQVIEPAYVDNDIGAANPDLPRPAYLKLMTDVAKGKVDVVVVYKEDRLHRQPIELEQFVAAAEKAGMTKLYSVKSGMTDLSDSSALMTLRIKGDVAAHEVEQLRERVARKKRALAEAGEWGGGRRPYGHQLVDKKLVLDKSEATVIRQVADQILKDTPLQTIARELNDREIPAPRSSTWTSQALRSMMLRPSIAGLRQHGVDEDRQPIIIGQADWKPILTEMKWRQVVDVLTNPGRSTPRLSRPYPLKSLLVCGECGSELKPAALSDKRRGSKRWYGCVKKRGGTKTKGCGRVWVGADGVEKYVLDVMLPLLDSPVLHEAIAEHEGDNANEAVELRAANARDEAKIKALAEMQLDPMDFVTAVKPIRATIEDRTTKLASLRIHSALDRLGGEVQTRWPDMSAEDRTLLLRSVLKSITVLRAVRATNRFDPNRLQFEFVDELTGRSKRAKDVFAVLADAIRNANNPPTPRFIRIPAKAS